MQKNTDVLEKYSCKTTFTMARICRVNAESRDLNVLNAVAADGMACIVKIKWRRTWDSLLFRIGAS